MNCAFKNRRKGGVLYGFCWLDDSEPYKTGWGCDPYWGWIVKTGDTGKWKKLRTMVMCYAWVQALLWFERSVPEAGTRHFSFRSLQSSTLIPSLIPDMGFGAVFLPTPVRSGWICSLSSISHFCRKLWMHACVIRGEPGKWDQMDATSCLALAQWRNHRANTFLKLHPQNWSQLLSTWVYMRASWRQLQSVAAKLRKWTWGKKMAVSKNGRIKMATKNNLYIEFSF